jgi:transcription initiation factor TFIIB
MENENEIWELLNSLKLVDENINDSLEICLNKKCKSNIFEFDEQDKICTKCGTIQSKNIDLGAEWRYYGNDDNKVNNPTRCGMPTNDFLPKSSLGSVIGMDNNSKNYYQMSRIRKYHMWNSMPYKERSLYNVMNKLNTTACNGGISPSIIEDAKTFYKNISEKKISRGDNRNGLIASAIYMSCKNNLVPRSAKEIATIFGLNITTMTKGCKKFQEIMKINVESTSPEDFVTRFCSKLNRSDIEPVCRYVVKKADEYSIVSQNSPPSVSSGCIYLCSQEYKYGLTKKQISKACEISEVTVNKCFKVLNKYKTFILPPEDFFK